MAPLFLSLDSHSVPVPCTKFSQPHIYLPPTISIRLSILCGGISALNIPVEQK